MPDETLVIDDDDRYARLRLIAWWDQQRLAASRVMVVGAGALGNEVLKNLALLGVGTIYLIDFDHIEHSNLTRSVLFRRRDCGRPKALAAAEAVRDINPDTRIYPFLANVLTEVGLGMFRDVDVVIGCLDNREARLWVNRCCWRVGTPWIDGGIQEINGVVKVFVPPDSACYECGMTENDYRLINVRYSCPLLRHEDVLAGRVPTAPTISSMIGGLQTQEALKLIHGLPVTAGAAMIYNGATNRFYTTHFQRREDCLSHDTFPDCLELPLNAARDSAADLLRVACARLNVPVESARIELDRELVVSVDCQPCGTSRSIMRPLQEVGQRDAICEQCSQLARPRLVHTIEPTSPWVHARLCELGIPPYDLVRVVTSSEEHIVLLADDQARIMAGDGLPGDLASDSSARQTPAP